ncbi:thiamine ABC transporter ATP-binding protein [Marivivens donghaensis]|uniref:thiamine ABC transporter ATP-binding protein n=1 Tax=Marivivens donghaensis TaxID=1699413 RepID=UPI00201F66E6|nr:ATP-binding cassette domain-containing protein [Marivivens donghaensis]MCL7409421.1 ATP-binding cassette domain-containing protein [Marivivens donghaensis]MDN3702900.1 ATP-binding cassette domain-containing protein [Marivivens donghaensis]
MLMLENLNVRQGDFHLTANVGFAAGQITALIGPSGAGKSTILSVIAGFYQAEGQVLWRGEPITDLRPDQRPVSILFQDNNLFPHLTVSQNVGLALRASLRLTRDEPRRVDEMLASVGLSGMGARKPAALSGGQQSRAALARLLLQDRPVILLDEPFAALGPGLKQEMLTLVRERALTDNRVVLMVTHDPQDALVAADQIALVDEGQLFAPLPAREVMDNPPDVLQRYLGTSS